MSTKKRSLNTAQETLQKRARKNEVDSDDEVELGPDSLYSDDENENEGQTGIIEKICLKNFMCHTALDINLNRNVNFIVGRNGSGKSAVMTALAVGLGGRARDTSRGSSVKGFIKAGKPFGEVSIKLSNTGNDAYKRDVFGESIVIERRFTQSTSGYKLKSAAGQTVSTKSEEVSRLLDHFNIQVDNPICMLNQDTSRNFLFSKKPEDKYKFFLKATELEKMQSEYEAAAVSHDESMRFIQSKKESLPHLESELKVWEKKAKAFTSIDELKAKVHTLKNELVWTLVNQDEKKLQELNRGLKEAEGRRPAHVKKVQESEEKHKSALEKKKALEAKVGSVARCRDEFDVKLRDLTKNKNAALSEKNKAETNVRYSSRDIDQLQRDVKLLDDRIKTILEQNNKDYSEDKRKREQEIEALESRINETKAQMTTNENLLEQFNRAVTKYKEDIYNLQRDHNEKSSTIRNLKSEITKFKNSKNDKWARFGDWVPKVKSDIQTALRRGVFRSEPKGPVGAYLELKHEEYSLSIEACLGGLMTTWVVDNAKDLVELEKLMRRHTPRLPNLSVSKYLDRRHDVSRFQADNSTYPCLFDLIKVNDPVIFNFLVDARGAENVLFILDSDEARPILQRNPPQNCKECFTRAGDQIFAGGEGGNYRYYSAEANGRVRFLVADHSAAVAVMEQEQRRLEAEAETIAQSLRAVQAEMESNKREKFKHDQHMTRLRQNLAKIQTEWTDLRAVEDPMPIDVTTLREDLDNLTSEIGKKKEVKAEWEEKLSVLSTRAADAQAKFDEVQTKLLDLVTNSENDALELNGILSDLPRLQSNISHYMAKMDQLEEDVRNKTEERDRQKELVDERVGKAGTVCPRMRAKRTPDHLKSEIVQIEKRIESEEEIHGDKEVVLQSYREKKAHVEDIKSKIAGLSHFAGVFNEIMSNRRENHNLFKHMLAQRIRAFFANMLEQRQYRGQLKFDHDKHTLDIHVQPQADASQQGDMRQLSGGERSFSTVCFVLSLWEAMESPFRCLDEFDVFMDNVNRAIAMQMMIHTTEKHKEQQFIFLTPLDMSHLGGKTGLKIFKMPDPERGQTTLDFKKKDEDNNNEH